MIREADLRGDGKLLLRTQYCEVQHFTLVLCGSAGRGHFCFYLALRDDINTMKQKQCLIPVLGTKFSSDADVKASDVFFCQLVC